jgi:hypothetical protein
MKQLWSKHPVIQTKQNIGRAMKTSLLKDAAGCLILAVVLGATDTRAQTAGPGSPSATQFDIQGFIQEATLDNPFDMLSGGTLKVNGHVVVVPRNLVVIMPAASLTWQELFTMAPPPYGPSPTTTTLQTGMALADVPTPLTTYEAHVTGNRVITGTGATTSDQYIAGLITISQHALNTGQGFINFIDYAKGELRVGGKFGDPTTGTRVGLNDPIVAGTTAGRYSRGQSPDPRFTADQENPTMRTTTGYPMGLPAVTADPNLGNPDDPLRPITQRPVDPLNPSAFLTIFTMPPPPSPAGTPDATLQLPFEVGDFVTFAGTLVKDGPQPTVGPFPAATATQSGTDQTYISAHTIIANLAWYTFPGTFPVYVATDVALLGVGGVNTPGIIEATTRTRFEGFCTDPSRIVSLWGMDVDSLTGAETDRNWGSINIDPGLPRGVQKGRWRFRPPSKVLSLPPTGVFLPATREVRAVAVGAWTPGQTTTVANGIIAGQYHAPITDYLFPEQIVGRAIPPANLETIPFLTEGSGPLPGSSPPVIVGPLSPFPQMPGVGSTSAPKAVLTPSQSVFSGATVVLDGSASVGSTPMGYVWLQTATAGLPPVTFSPGNLTPVVAFVAPILPVGGQPAVLTFQLTVTNRFGSSTATENVTVSPPGVPIADAGPPQVINESAINPSPIVNLDGSGSIDPNRQRLFFHWTQTGGPTITLSDNNSPTAVTPFFTARALPVGSPPDVYTFNLVVSNAGGVSSAPASTSVTVNGLPDTVTIATVVYRASQQRLTVTATSSAGSAATLTLDAVPELNIPQTVFVPVLGIPTADVKGVPTPSTTQLFVVRSSLGGVASSPVTRFR